MTEVPVNLGTRATISVVWPNGPGEAAPGANLTGYSLALVDVTEGLTGKVSIAAVDLSVGTMAITVQETVQAFVAAPHSFRIRITSPGGVPTTTPPIEIVPT